MTTPESATTNSVGSATLATGAIGFVAYSIIALALLHVLRPDYAPASNFISNYAVGPFGWIMATWFLAQAGGMLLLSAGLSRSGLRSPASRMAMFLMVIAALGLVVSAIFPTDIPGAPDTRAGDIHDNSFLVIVGCVLLMSLLLPIGFGSHPRWRSFRATAWTLAALIIIAFVIQFATMQEGMPYGLANRFFVVVLFAWELATMMRLRAVLSSDSSAEGT